MWDSPDNPSGKNLKVIERFIISNCSLIIAPKPPVNITQKVNDKDVKSDDQLKNNAEMVNGNDGTEGIAKEEEGNGNLEEQNVDIQKETVSIESNHNEESEKSEESEIPKPTENGTSEKVDEPSKPVEQAVEN